MLHASSRLLRVLSLTCVFSAVSACGGSSFTSGGSGGTSSTGSGGNPGSGGGAGMGGSSALPESCQLPQESGPCEAMMPAWWHDPATGLCQPFIYGGCGGNANRFDSRAACQAACAGGVPNLDSCTSPTDCVLVSAGCCAACEPVDERAFVAVSQAQAATYAGRCGLIACAPCVGLSPGVYATGQNFAATCVSGECTVVDIRESPVSACTTAADCVLRVGASCCEGCSGDRLVAVNPAGNLSALVCGTEPVGCPACLPMIPSNYGVTCTSDHCAVVWPACTDEDPCPL